MAFWFVQKQSNPNKTMQIDESYSINQLHSNSALNNRTSKRNILIKESDGSSSESEEDKDVQIGHKKLSTNKSAYFNSILQMINSKRKTILKGLRFAYENISSAKDIIELISSSFLLLKANIPAQLCHLYLINDILFNSQNASIKYAWIYKELIHDGLPELFQSINNQMKTDELMKEHLSQLMKIWSSWSVFTDEYLIGLAFPMRKPIDDGIIEKYQFEAKDGLEKYEDMLLEIYSEDSDRLKEIALANGIFNKISTEEMISRLVSLKEFLIYKEKEIDNCDDLNKTIEKLQSVLEVMRNAYNKLNPLDLDGIEINEIEYEYFSLPLDDEPKQSLFNNKDSMKDNDQNNNQHEDDDIDGEPI